MKKGTKGKAQASTIKMDARNFVRAINEGALSRVKQHERLIRKMGENVGKNFALTSLDPSYSRCIFEDVDTGAYFGAAVRKSGSKIEIYNVKEIAIHEEKKAQIFSEFCKKMVDCIAEEDLKGAESEFNKIEHSRFRPRIIPESGDIVTKDGKLHNIQLDKPLMAEDKQRRLIEAVVECLSDRVELDHGRVVKAVLSEDGDKPALVLPITETTRRRRSAQFMKEHAMNAWKSGSFQQSVRKWAGYICEDKIVDAVKEAAGFLREYQEFCVLTYPETIDVVDKTLASTGSMNPQLAQDTAKLMYKTNLKVNKNDIIEEWKKVAKRTENVDFIENASMLSESKNLEEDYDGFLNSFLAEGLSGSEADAQAYETAMAAIVGLLQNDVADDEEKEAVLQDATELHMALQTNPDEATISQARDFMAGLDTALINDVANLGDFDSMPEAPSMPTGLGEPGEGIAGGTGAGMGGPGMGEVEGPAETLAGGEEGLDLGGPGTGEPGMEPEMGEPGTEPEMGEPGVEPEVTGEEGTEDDAFDFGLDFEEEEEEEGPPAPRRREEEVPELSLESVASDAKALMEAKGESHGDVRKDVKEFYEKFRENHVEYVTEHGIEKATGLIEHIVGYLNTIEEEGAKVLALGFQNIIDFHTDMDVETEPVCEDPYGCLDEKQVELNRNYGTTVDEGGLPEHLKKHMFKKKGSKGVEDKGPEEKTEKPVETEEASVDEDKMPEDVKKRFQDKGEDKGEEKEEVEEDQFKFGTKRRRINPRRASLSQTEGVEAGASLEGQIDDAINQIAAAISEDNDVTDPDSSKYAEKAAAEKDGAGKKRNPETQVGDIEEDIAPELNSGKSPSLDYGTPEGPGNEIKEGPSGDPKMGQVGDGGGVTGTQSGGEVKEGAPGNREHSMDSPTGQGVVSKGGGGEFKEGTPGNRESKMDSPTGKGVAEEIEAIADAIEEDNDITDPTKGGYATKDAAEKDGDGSKRNEDQNPAGEYDGGEGSSAPAAPGNGDVTSPEASGYTSDQASKVDGEGHKRNPEKPAPPEKADGSTEGGHTM